MRFPQQPDNIEEDRQALAPYNFVPLPERLVKLSPDTLPAQDSYLANRLSGYIECELTTESPVYTRAAVPLEHYQRGIQAKDNPAFFYVNDEDEPVIPGSSLRGMLRSLVEIVTYSKVGPVSNERLVYRAVGDTTNHGERYRSRLMRFDGEIERKKHYTPLMRGGYIVKHYGEWAIRPAKEIDGTTFAYLRIDEDFLKTLRPVAGCRNAFHIYVRTGAYRYQPVRGDFLRIKYAPVLEQAANPHPGLRAGTTVARSGWMNSKLTEAVIYEEDKQVDPLLLSDELLDAYRNQISPEQEKLLGNNGALREGQPVFYILNEDGSVHFWGHCRMFRLPYLQSPRDHVPEQLRRDEDLDVAESIFGYTKRAGTGKTRGYAGRLFVSDAHLLPEQGNVWLARDKIVVPRILASPKPTTFQHYLVQTKPNKQPAGRTRDGRPKYTVELSDYAAPTPGETMIRGHKLYWHKGAVSLESIQEAKALTSDDKQHTRIQPLRPGVQFRFRLDFANLALVELGALLWVLDVAADPQYRLKIGMGKPLGMGAIKIKSTLFLVDRQARYRRLLDGNDWAHGVSEDQAKHQEAVAQFERFMLKAIDQSAARRLADVARIQALLTLLSWPGPDPAKTRYLEIERWEGGRKKNEYRGRPVLPTPKSVAGQAEAATSSTTATPPSTDARRALPSGYQRGRVKKFDRSYGFIQPDGGGRDVFVHQNQLRGMRTLAEGQRVIFRIGDGMRGPEAQDVRLEN